MQGSTTVFFTRLLKELQSKAGIFVLCVILILVIREILLERGKLSDLKKVFDESVCNVKRTVEYLRNKKHHLKKNVEEKECAENQLKE